MKTPIVFFGASSYLTPTLAMLNQHYDVKLVITTETKPTDAIPAYCTQNMIPYISLNNFSDPDIYRQLSAINAPLAVVSYFGLLVPEKMIETFPKGMVNIHPSLLPEYRGATPGTSALRDGKTETGVSIMLIDRNMDHGPILAQEKEPIYPSDTAETLYTRLFDKGTKLLEKVLPLYMADTLTIQEQDHTKATFCKGHLTRQDGFVDIQNPPSSITLDRIIRAYYPWPGAWTKLILNGKEKIVKLLPGNHLQVEGKKPMTIKEFSNGYPEAKEQLKKLGLGN